MAVYEYTGANSRREDHLESGTIVAKNKRDALEKLRQLSLSDVHLKKLGPLAGFFRAFTADIR